MKNITGAVVAEFGKGKFNKIVYIRCVSKKSRSRKFGISACAGHPVSGRAARIARYLLARYLIIRYSVHGGVITLNDIICKNLPLLMARVR